MINRLVNVARFSSRRLQRRARRLATQLPKRLAPTSRRVRKLAVQVPRRAIDLVDPARYHECPCCGELAISFLPQGPSQRENARCPSCGSAERNRLQWLYLRDKTNLFTDRLEALHFAPEVALRARLTSLPDLIYHSADLTSNRAAEHFDICAIPYADDTFDVILCSHVLEHVPDDRKAMSELFRVMRPGGWGMIDVPFDDKHYETVEDPSITSDAERIRVYGNKGHLRMYGLDFPDRLRAAGFEVTVNRYAREFAPALIEKYRLPGDGVVTIATKPGLSPSDPPCQ
jgi:SAM-dependent methyltransferase